MNGAAQGVLQAQGITLRAGTRTLLEALDWRVHAGQFWCVLGRNGVGKSTLLHAAAGLLPVHAGQWHLQGVPLARMSPAQMARHRGLLLQHQHDAFAMPVLDAVQAGCFVHHGGWSATPEAQAAALQALERVGLAALAGADLLHLSGGERQRVGLATLLAQDPALYLLDEPTSHQDIAAQLQVMALLRGLAQQGKAVVASCHDLNLASRFATHVLLLDGQGACAGTVHEVMQPQRLEAAFACRFVRVREAGLELFFPQ